MADEIEMGDDDAHHGVREFAYLCGRGHENRPLRTLQSTCS
jgi:hypothetical protein